MFRLLYIKCVQFEHMTDHISGQPIEQLLEIINNQTYMFMGNPWPVPSECVMSGFKSQTIWIGFGTIVFYHVRPSVCLSDMLLFLVLAVVYGMPERYGSSRCTVQLNTVSERSFTYLQSVISSNPVWSVFFYLPSQCRVYCILLSVRPPSDTTCLFAPAHIQTKLTRVQNEGLW